MLWKASTDGASKTQLSLPGFSAAFPRWSPDGSRIAVTAHVAGGLPHVFVVPANGGAPESPMPNQQAYDVDWAPDGRSLLVVHSIPDQPNRRALFLVEVATGREKMVPGSIDRFFPHWSRDGRYIEAQDDNKPGVLILNRATNQWQEVVRGTIGYPAWSHDSRYLFYQKVLEENQPIYRYDPRNQLTERVADCKAELEAGVSRCVFLGVAQDDSPLFDITRGSSDLYSAELSLPR
jgi:Tol biopolymer transport system component